MKKFVVLGIILILASLSFAQLPEGIDVKVSINSAVQTDDTLLVVFGIENEAEVGGLQFQLVDDPNVFELVSYEALGRLADVNSLQLLGQDSTDEVSSYSLFLWYSMALDKMAAGIDEHIAATYVKTGAGGQTVDLKIINVKPAGPFGEVLVGIGDSTTVAVISSVEDEGIVAQEFSLAQNYPNPFNPTTEIAYNVPRQEFVSVNIFDLRGNFIRNLANEVHNPGVYRVVWDAKDSKGIGVASGVYLYTLEAGTRSISKRMILMR